MDDHDITKLAAVAKGSQKQGGASTAEEGRGPHVALSVRLKRKDPDRQFHIGERVPYILMANSNKLQVNRPILTQFSHPIEYNQIYQRPLLYSRLDRCNIRVLFCDCKNKDCTTSLLLAG